MCFQLLRYKLLRADSIDDLVADFYGYAGVHRACGIAVRACQCNDDTLLTLLAELPTVPLELVSGTTATDRRGTLLHYVAKSPNAIPRSLLEKTVLHSELKQVWNVDGTSAFTLAGTKDVQQLLDPGPGLVAVEALFRATQGPIKWRHADNWGTTQPLSQWKGIELEVDHIAKLKLEDIGLAGW